MQGTQLLCRMFSAALTATTLRINVLDVAGALCSEDQFELILPLIVRDNAMLSSTYYHFREFRTKSALLNVLRYFGYHPNELNSYHAGSYVEGILGLIAIHFDDEV